MSFESIQIVRQYPIINNYVQIENNLERNKTAVSLAAALAASPTSTIANLSTGGAFAAGGKHGVQCWLETCWSANVSNHRLPLPNPITQKCAEDLSLTSLVS